MNTSNMRGLSTICFVCGFLSIAASIAIWMSMGGGLGFPTTIDSLELAKRAYAERFGIFVGLWAPTFFILSNRFDRFASERMVATQ